MTLLDGRPLSAAIRGEVAATAGALPSLPVLAAVVATDEPGAAWYLGSIARSAAAAGIELRQESVDHTAGAVRQRLKELSADEAVHAIICLTPLPEGLTLTDAGEHIAPAKDVDGASPASLGRLAAGLTGLGLGRGDRVVLLMPNRIELVETLWAAFHGGFVAVPVNWHLHPDEVDYKIPGNDDAIRSAALLTRVVADAVAEGLMARSAAAANAGRDEKPEVDTQGVLDAGDRRLGHVVDGDVWQVDLSAEDLG